MADESNESNEEEGEEEEEETLLRNIAEGLPAVMEMQQAHSRHFDALRGNSARRRRTPEVCHHGGPGAAVDARRGLTLFQPIHFYIKMCEEQEPRLEYDAFYGYWAMKGEASISETGSKVLKSMAVSATLDNDYKGYQDSRMYMGIATKFDAILKLGGLRSFIDAVQYNRKTLVEEGSDPALRGYYRAMQQMCSNHGLVESLSTVCSCLENIRAHQSHTCDTCLKRHQRIMKCSRCRQACYCSQSCQRRDWKYHKRYCNKFLNAQKQLETMLPEEQAG
jgi:hypothetical protein